VVLHVDGPEGEAEPRKYCHPPNPKVRSAGVLHRYFKDPDHEIKTVEYVSLPAWKIALLSKDAVDTLFL
jgi:hypothetical protein